MVPNRATHHIFYQAENSGFCCRHLQNKVSKYLHLQKIPKPKPGGNFVRYASEHRLSKVLGESPPEAAVHRSSTKSVFSQNSLEKTCTGVFF